MGFSSSVVEMIVICINHVFTLAFKTNKDAEVDSWGIYRCELE